jgi:hypothetical protein
MKTRVLALLLALPLAAFDCGGKEEQAPVNPFGQSCQLHVGGGASEDLWCIVTAYDYSDLDPQSTMWAFELVAYRGMTEVGAGAGFFHDGRPLLGTPYGWSGASTTNVDSGGATRSVGDLTADPPTFAYTHEAWAPLGVGDGTGSLSVTFSQIPPPGAVGPALLLVHGTLTATVPAVDGVSAPVTFSATF